MVSKKILGLAIAAAFSSQAFATINLNDKDDAGSTVTFAKEALLTTQTVTGNDSATYYKVGAAANNKLNAKVVIGTGFIVGQKRYLRVDLTNAVFTAASNLSSTATTVANAGATAAGSLVQGGQNKDTYAILELTAGTANITQTDVETIVIEELAISGVNAVGVGASVYETLTAAVNQTAGTVLNSKSLSSPIKTAAGYKVNVGSPTVTANVSDAFKKFVTSGTGADSFDSYKNLGTLTVTAESVLKRNASANVVLADVIDDAASKVKFLGDFSVGSFKLAAAPITSANCTAGDTLLFNTAKSQSTQWDNAGTATDTTVAKVNAKETLCVVTPGDKVIPKGAYTAEVALAKATDSAFAPAAQTVTLGTIAHNGTTIQVPYLTTLADYNQRVVLVNRGGADAAYTFNFTTEAGNTATAGTKATGTLAKNSTTVIKASDIVSLSGNTRTAATINIVAISGNIDAATTTVNLSDKSTDTVKLQ